MQYAALATDFDGTIAHDGVVDDTTLAALERLRASGRRVILVTGRELDDLQRVMPRLDVFDRVVAENGALLYCPATRTETLLAETPPERFVSALREAGVQPLSVGRVIVATWEPNENTVLHAIRDLGLGLQVIFNKGAVMVLPAGISKESGLRAALADLGIAALNTVGVGDAENDFPFVDLCGLSVAVANALPMLKEAAGLVTEGARGAGVTELIDRILATDLAEIDPANKRQSVVLANESGDGGEPLSVAPTRENLLVVGASGGGKSTLTTGLLERLAERHFQCCVIDPEGDYECLATAVAVGSAQDAPRIDAVMDVLRKTEAGASVNLLAVKLGDRPAFFAQLLPALLAERQKIGRPHVIVVDEAHHMVPREADPDMVALPEDERGFVFVTVRPESVASRILKQMDRIVAVGREINRALTTFCEAHGLPKPETVDELPVGQLATLSVTDPTPRILEAQPSSGTRRRHLRKYAEGQLGDDRAFFFRGPEGKLNLRAGNLITFLDLADGVDAETWAYHRARGDYGRWICEVIKDRDLADEIGAIEHSDEPPEAARTAIRAAIEARYTLPA